MKHISLLILATFAVTSTCIAEEPEYPHIIDYINQQDQIESTNRSIHKFNSYMGDYVQKPIAVTWASIMPEHGIKCIGRAFNNFAYPQRLVNSLLQADFSASGTETLRFLANTTVGVLGLYDPAKDWWRIQPRQKDFGQTMCKWGVEEGSYVVFPIAGGNNMRDGVGSIVDNLFNPLFYLSGFAVEKAVAGGVKAGNQMADFQSEIELLNNNSADPYAMQKFYFYLRRLHVLNDFDDFKKNMATIKTLYRQELAKVPQTVGKIHPDSDLADLRIKNYKGQSPEIDSFRYLKFKITDEDESIWDDASIWNNEFKNSRKFGEVHLREGNRPLPYSYWLQDKENAPIAYILPRGRGGVYSRELDALAKMYFDKDYSVIILPNIFNWEFVMAGAGSWLPGYVPEDIKILDKAVRKIHDDFIIKNDLTPQYNILTGVSMGGLHAIKLADLDRKSHKQMFTRVIAVNPPVDFMHAMKVYDGYNQIWKEFNSEQELMLASMLLIKQYMIMATVKKEAIQKAKSMKNPFCKLYGGMMPFVQSEAKALFSLKEKETTIELLYTLFKYDRSLLPSGILSGSDNKHLYKTIMAYDLNDYAEKVLVPFYKRNRSFSMSNLKEDSNLFNNQDMLTKDKRLYVIHTVDDMFLSRKHKLWLKKTMGKRCIMFDHGGHLGELYTDGFKSVVKKMISKK